MSADASTLKAVKNNKCLFCKISEGSDPKSPLLYQDDEFFVFRDIRPASTHHFLVCPQRHIKNPKELTGDNVELVESMVRVGRQVLEEQKGDMSDIRFGFHWPPFNAIAHLHLHVISPQANMGFLSRGIFRPNSLWFVTDEWLLNRLKELQNKAAT